MKPLTISAFVFVCVVTAVVPAYAEDEIDYVALATTLAGDGHFDRAEVALKSVDLQSESTDKSAYYLVSGLIALNRSEWARAIEDFEALVALDKPADGWVYGYLAQAFHGAGDHRKALRNLDKVGAVGVSDAGLWLLKVDSERKLSRHEAAWKTLSDAEARFSDDVRFARQKTTMLLELGLYSEAADYAQKLVNHPNAKPEDALAFAEGLRKAGAYERAIPFLERTRLRYDDPRFDALLGYCYANTSRFLAAGELLAISAESEPKYRSEAAEMFRKAGDMTRALYHNSLVVDPRQKLRQRVAILVEGAKYEQIAALYARLKRTKVLDDDAIRYAVAYAQFQVGQIDKSLVTLKGIQDPSYFDSATRLRELIARCRKENAC